MLLNRPSLAAALLACAAWSPPIGAHAQDAAFSPQYNACIKKSDSITTEMVECITAEHARQDKRLNAGYKTLMAKLTPERKKQLQATQRLWLQFRDANCGFYADPDGGSLARIAANQCHLDMTTRRAQEFENLP